MYKNNDLINSDLRHFETEPVKCVDKSFLCARIDESTDCTDDDVQKQCPKSCNTCRGTYIYNRYKYHTKGNLHTKRMQQMKIA